MVCHDLKCWPGPFAAVLDGRKTFEIRKADRDFHVGDHIRLCEWVPDFEGLDPVDFSSFVKGHYTNREIRVEITYMVTPGSWGLPSDLCVMAIRPVEAKSERKPVLSEKSPAPRWATVGYPVTQADVDPDPFNGAGDDHDPADDHG